MSILDYILGSAGLQRKRYTPRGGKLLDKDNNVIDGTGIILELFDAETGLFKVAIKEPIEANGGVPVNLQDQTTKPIVTKFNQVHNSTELDEAGVIFSYDIEVVANTGIVVGSYIIIFDTASTRFMFANALAINGTTITLDTPLDFAYPAGTFVDVATTNLNVNGAVTPQVFGLRGTGVPPGVGVTGDITRIIFSCITDTAIDLSKFADIAKLTRGLVLRRRNGTTENLFNVKSNREIAGIMYDFAEYSADNPVQGVDGFASRLTFAGQNKIGVAIRIAPGEDLELVVQDDLRAITTLEIIAEGHIVSDD